MAGGSLWPQCADDEIEWSAKYSQFSMVQHCC